MLNFDFLGKGLGTVSPPHFENDFSRKIVLILYSTNWPNFILSILYFLRYWPRCVLQLLINQVVAS